MTAAIRHIQHLQRYRQIIRSLIRHGFGGLIDQLGLLPVLSLPHRLLRRTEAGPPLTAPEHLRLALEELGPIFIKLGQILSTRPDVMPPTYIRELSKLQDIVPPSPWQAVKARIETELGAPVEKLFASFEVEPLATASLAQVHGANLFGGEEVVVKVQRPAIEKLVEADLEILLDLAQLLQSRTPLGDLYDLPEIAEEFAYTLRNEMDFHREGHNADRFRRNFAGEPALYIPEVYWNYTSRRVLTLERIHGIKIDDIGALDAAEVDRHQVALNAARIIIKEVLEDGFFHADPHPGNFFVMDGAVIGAMDFGMVGHLSRRTREELIHLYIAAIGLDSTRIVDQLIRMGTAGRRVDRERLGRDLGRLLTKYYGLPLREIRARELVEEVTPIAFRHHLHLPSELWLLAKTLAMMEGVGLKLAPDFDIFEVSQPYIRRFVRQMASPRTWSRRLARSAHDWGELLAWLPQRAPQLLEQAQRGQLELVLNLKGMKWTTTRLDRIANRLAISILVAAFIISLAILAPLVAGSGQKMVFRLVMAGFLTAAGLGLVLLVSIWRAGRR